MLDWLAARVQTVVGNPEFLFAHSHIQQADHCKRGLARAGRLPLLGRGPGRLAGADPTKCSRVTRRTLETTPSGRVLLAVLALLAHIVCTGGSMPRPRLMPIAQLL